MNEKRDNYETLPERLKVARRLAGLSQSQVALILKMQRPTISEIEAGRRRVSTDELVGFSEAYGVSVEWLATGGRNTSVSEDVLAVAARKLEKMRPDDLRRVVEVLSMIEEQRRED